MNVYPHRSFIIFKSTLFIKLFSTFSICKEEIGTAELLFQHKHHLLAYSCTDIQDEQLHQKYSCNSNCLI